MDESINAKERDEREFESSEAYDFEYWAKHFKISVDELKSAISKVGNSTEEIEKYLKK
ncbi:MULTISPECIES: DUF3606 domain-containing protein [Mucilaginibacter]|jgi:molecular chaperone GrpE (heat shock protein)|uniref:DUF3606 domain-containing protein n=1 Tax=Mucilaginibacter agri TaxID=2695265 RepID=A0A966DSG6_9SPHI|nr:MULTISPECIES: DUF3606 domain-containing protein [Mucilaginibacter]NCD67779.1 DUF3606 domain-containing protein [Mucilaginibacter agri]NHA05775.1 DUF3606 domain-containing protein [Mucilaginibacter inviolabilis]